MCATTVVFAALVGLLLGLIFLAPLVCAVLGALFGIGYWVFACWAADRFALDAYDAVLVDAVTSPNLYKVIAKLANDAHIEPPLIYSLPYGPPNAFAVSRMDRSSVIVLSNALMRTLDHDEVRAILALMVARIAESDSAACSIAATLAGIPFYGICHPSFRGWLRDRMQVDPATGLTKVEKFLISLATPPALMTIRIAFDATLLKRADVMAVRLTGSAAPLASALSKIDRARVNDWWGNTAFNPATGILFALSPLVYTDGLPTSNPFLVKSQRAFTTPIPPVEQRLEILMRGAPDSGGTAVPA
jgi:heat shock protein HtpX